MLNKKQSNCRFMHLLFDLLMEAQINEIHDAGLSR